MRLPAFTHIIGAPLSPEGIPIGHRAARATVLGAVMMVPGVAIALTIIVPVRVGMVALITVVAIIFGIRRWHCKGCDAYQAGTQP